MLVELGQNTSSPEIFRKWAAISAVAGVLERKVFVRTMGSALYPNMYIILVAPPGVGKTEMTWRVRDMWQKLDTHHIASTSVTKASLIDELDSAVRRVIDSKNKLSPVTNFNSLLLCVNELGVLLPAYENEFMNTLTDLWDCKSYSERRRSKNIEIKITAPQLHMLAACTPSYLMSTLPEGAWDQGFLSRTLLIYSGVAEKTSLFAEKHIDKGLEKRAQKRLTELSVLTGKMAFTEDAAGLIDAFHMDRAPIPKPDHPKLLSYNIRRTVHLLKLMMVASVSRTSSMVIEEEDFTRALGWLLEAETFMPDIFKAMTQGGAGDVMRDAWHFVFKAYAKEQKPILKARLIQFLQERVPVHSIEPTIDMMIKGNLLSEIPTKVGPGLKPIAKRVEN